MSYHAMYVALIVAAGLCSVLALDASNASAEVTHEPVAAATAATSTVRSGRMLVPPQSHVGHSNRFNLKPPPPMVQQRIRPRSDQFVQFGPEGHQRRYPEPPYGIALSAARPKQILRRVHNNIGGGGGVGGGAAPQRFNYGSYDTPPKNGRYVGDKASGGSNGKGGGFRTAHPNALSGGGGGGGGLALPQNPQYLGHAHHQQQQFKASPHYNGQAIIRPISEFEQQQQQQQSQSQQQQQQQLPYQTVKQYPLPQQPPMQQQQLPQQQQQHHHQRPQTPYQSYTQHTNYHNGQQDQPYYSNVQHEQEQSVTAQHKQVQQQHKQSTYSVYEDAFDGASNDRVPAPQYMSAHNMADGNAEVQDYLKFMSTNEYFLPKREPDYKLLDSLKDQRQLQKQYQQNDQVKTQSQHPQNYAYQQQQQQQQQPPKHYEKYLGKTTSSASSAGSAYQEPILVSDLFYDVQPSQSANVVRGSYQAGSNTFVVNSDGNKAIKHIVPSPLPAIQVTTPSSVGGSAYGQNQQQQQQQQQSEAVYNNNAVDGSRRRTPEPLRFEFTEHDAVSAVSYTNAPSNQLRYNTLNGGPSTTTMPATTPRTPYGGGVTSASSLRYNNNNNNNNNNYHDHHHNSNNIKPVSESDDDPEDGEDMQEASSDIYGRVPLRPVAVSVLNVSSTQAPPPEQKDTEEYCERICSVVQDDDEEIVCGSDGYMYTSEAQMDCYAECLRIDVTIQSKGSCSAR